MVNCEINFKKNGIIAHLHPATKQLIIDDICQRLEELQDEMKKHANGRIIVTYEDEHLILEIKGYPAELAALMDQAIRKQTPRQLLSPLTIDEIRKN